MFQIYFKFIINLIKCVALQHMHERLAKIILKNLIVIFCAYKWEIL